MSTSVGSITADFDARSAKFAAELEKIRKDIAGLKGNSDSLTKSFGALGTVARTFVGVFSAGAIVGIARSMFQAADAIGDAAGRASQGVESFSRLKFIAEQKDVAFASLTNSVRFYQASLSRAIDGNKEAAEAFGALALRAEDLRGLSIEDALSRIADQFKKVQDPADRTRIAVELFGRAGQDLVPLLAEGGEAIRRLAAESDRLGATLNTRTVAGISAADDALKKLKATAFGFGARTLGNIALALGFGSDDPVVKLRLQVEELQQRRTQLLASAGKEQLGPGMAQDLARINAQLDPLLARLQAIDAIQRGEGGTRGPSSRAPLVQIRAEVDKDTKKKEETEKEVIDAVELRRAVDDAVAEETRAARQRDLDEASEFAQRSLEVQREAIEQRIALEQQAAAAETQIRADVFSNAVTLLNLLGSRNKAAAIAAIAIQRARAISEALVHSKVAAVLAYSSQLVAGDPSSIARAQAAYAKTIALGRINAALIAATGALEVANVVSGERGGIGNTGLGTPSNPLPVAPVGRSSGGGAESREVTTVNFYGPVAGEEAFADILRRLDERGIVYIRRNGAQAAEIRGGG